MSQIPSLQCLFCQHLNSADAVFCDDCGGQLNLQPCDRCDAVDSRTATHCHKCGAEFSVPAAPVPGLPPMPVIAGKEPLHPPSTNAEGVGSGAAHPNRGPTYPHPEKQSIGEVQLLETPATATMPRRGAPAAVLALLLLLAIAAVSVYLYRGRQPVNTAQTPAAGAHKPGKVPPLTPPGADAAPAARPLPATDAETKTPQNLPMVEKCPPAVATLGLCNPDTQQEKP